MIKPSYLSLFTAIPMKHPESITLSSAPTISIYSFLPVVKAVMIFSLSFSVLPTIVRGSYLIRSVEGFKIMSPPLQ